MRAFDYRRVDAHAAAVRLAADGAAPPAQLAAGPTGVEAAAASGDVPPTLSGAQFLAGGTTLLDLMKLDVMRPATLIDLNGLEREYGGVRVDEQGLWLGALTRMSAVGEDPRVLRDYPVIAQSLQLAASPQLRNMATLGGNVLQRTRCNYFRDPSYVECNKRVPGSGCAALRGCNRRHAVLGVSAHCIASYAGDFAQALVALEASVEIYGAAGRRSLPIEGLHCLPGDTPQRETVLAPSDLVLGFRVPARPWIRRSLYLKVRDRQSYEFALTSAAVALELRGAVIHQARIALGGVATVPWRAHAAEAALHQVPADEAHARAAAEAEFAAAVTAGQNDFKPKLGRRTLVRAILECAALRDAGP